MNDKLSLTFGQVENLIVAMLDVHDDRMGALRARMRLFRRLGFPDGVNVGTSGRFVYDFKATFTLLIAFAMTDALLMPQQAASIVTEAWPRLEPALQAVLRSVDFEDDRPTNAGAAADAPLLQFVPHALAQWRQPAAGGPDDGDDDEYRLKLPGRIEVTTLADVGKELLLQSRSVPKPAMLVMDLRSIVEWIARASVAAGWADPARLKA